MKFIRSILILALIMVWCSPVFGASVSCSKEATSDGPFHPGETIDYDIIYTNVNSFQLTVTTAVDNPPGAGSNMPFDTGPNMPTTLESGLALEWTYAYLVPQNAVSGTVTNGAIIEGYRTDLEADEANCYISTTDEIVVPCVEVVKTVDTPISKAGDNATFTIEVTNCGEPTIDPVSVTDNYYGDLTSEFGTLLQGESESFSYKYLVQADDPDPIVNTVEVEYVDQYDTNSDFTVTDDNATEVDLVHPAFTIAVSCMTEDPEPGDSVLFDAVFTNTGDIALLLATNLPAPNSTISLAAEGIDSEKTVTITKTITEEDLGICVEATATLPTTNLDNVIGPVEDCGTCTPEMDGLATRTLGFWKTHCEYTEHVFEDHCGGEIDLGWTTVTSIEDVLGVLFSNPAKQSWGKKRKGICKVRAMPTKQALVALLNNCLDNGASLPDGYSPTEIADILDNGSKNEIKMLGSDLDEYNNMGDDEAIIDQDGFMLSSATPQDCRDAADLSAADCP